MLKWESGVTQPPLDAREAKERENFAFPDCSGEKKEKREVGMDFWLLPQQCVPSKQNE